jgi:nucleoside-diphosphate-sugar epimerase
MPVRLLVCGGRVVAVSAGTFFDTSGGLERAEAMVSKEPSDDPTLVAIAAKAASEQTARRSLTETRTYKRLGYSPISLDDGLFATTAWLRDLGKVKELKA